VKAAIHSIHANQVRPMLTAIPKAETIPSLEIKPSLSLRLDWTTAAALALAAFYFATSIYIASHRLFWIDGIFTVLVARLPHFDNDLAGPRPRS
jgi:hypothetical protein